VSIQVPAKYVHKWADMEGIFPQKFSTCSLFLPKPS
jgi:hypothetical protein